MTIKIAKPLEEKIILKKFSGKGRLFTGRIMLVKNDRTRVYWKIYEHVEGQSILLGEKCTVEDVT